MRLRLYKEWGDIIFRLLSHENRREVARGGPVPQAYTSRDPSRPVA